MKFIQRWYKNSISKITRTELNDYVNSLYNSFTEVASEMSPSFLIACTSYLFNVKTADALIDNPFKVDKIAAVNFTNAISTACPNQGIYQLESYDYKDSSSNIEANFIQKYLQIPQDCHATLLSESDLDSNVSISHLLETFFDKSPVNANNNLQYTLEAAKLFINNGTEICEALLQCIKEKAEDISKCDGCIPIYAAGIMIGLVVGGILACTGTVAYYAFCKKYKDSNNSESNNIEMQSLRRSS